MRKVKGRGQFQRAPRREKSAKPTAPIKPYETLDGAHDKGPLRLVSLRRAPGCRETPIARCSAVATGKFNVRRGSGSSQTQ
jgi:hypothetical protein